MNEDIGTPANLPYTNMDLEQIKEEEEGKHSNQQLETAMASVYYITIQLGAVNIAHSCRPIMISSLLCVHKSKWMYILMKKGMNEWMMDISTKGRYEGMKKDGMNEHINANECIHKEINE